MSEENTAPTQNKASTQNIGHPGVLFTHEITTDDGLKLKANVLPKRHYLYCFSS